MAKQPKGLVTGVTAKIPGEQKATRMAKRPSSLEIAFMKAWRTFADHDRYAYPNREHRFHPTRKWRFDFAWPDDRLAVEMEGGVFSHPVKCDKCKEPVERFDKRTKRMVRVYATYGGHTTNTNFQADCAKYNAAAGLGWIVLRYTSKDMEDRPVQVVEEIMAVLSHELAAYAETQRELFEPVTRDTVREKTKELFS